MVATLDLKVSIKLDSETLHQFDQKIKLSDENNAFFNGKSEKIAFAMLDKNGVLNWKQIMDSVCFTDAADMSTLEKVVDYVTKHNGKAVLATFQPTFVSSIPIIVIDNEEIIKALKDKDQREQTFISFKPSRPDEFKDCNETPIVQNDIPTTHKHKYTLSITDPYFNDRNVLELSSKYLTGISLSSQKIVQVRFSDNGSRIFNSSRDINGSICSVETTKVTNISSVISELIKNDAKVIFVNSSLPFVPKIPVIELDSEIFENITKDTSVDFCLIGDDEEEHHSNLDSNDDLRPFDESANAENSNVQPVLSRVSLEEQPLPNATSRDRQTKESGGVWNSLKNKAMEVGKKAIDIVTFKPQPKCRDELKSIIEQPSPWFLGKNECYVRAVKILNESMQAENRDLEMEEICSQSCSVLEAANASNDLLKLSFGIQVLEALQSYRSGVDQRKNLKVKIFDVFLKLEVDTLQKQFAGFETPYGLKANNPHQTILDYFGDKIESTIAQVRMSLREKFILNYVGVALHHCNVEQNSLVQFIAPHVHVNYFETAHDRESYSKLFSNPVAFHSLALLSTKSFEQFCSRYGRLQQSIHGEIIVLESVCRKLSMWLRKKVGVENFEESLSTIINIFNTIAVPGQSREKNLTRLITTFVLQNGYNHCKTYDRIIKIWDYVKIDDDECCSIVRQEICSCIEKELKTEKLKNDGENILIFKEILTHKIGESILARDGFLDILCTYLHDVNSPLATKITFLGNLHRAMVKSSDSGANNIITKKIAQITIDIVPGNPLVELFSIAAENAAGALFEQEDLEIDITNILLKQLATKEAVFKLENFEYIQLFSCTFRQKSFNDIVQREVISILNQIHINIESATDFFTEFVGDTKISRVELNPEYLHLICRDIVINSISEWKPNSFRDVARLSTRVLETIAQCIEHKKSDVDGYFDMSTLGLVVKKWISKFEQEDMEIEEVEVIFSLINIPKHLAIRSFIADKFPSPEDLENYITESKKTCQKIFENTFIEVNQKKVSLNKILSEYKAVINTIPFVGEMIDLCSKKYDEVEKNYMKNSLQNIKVQLNTLENFLSRFEEELKIASYFVGKKSLLYHYAVDFSSWSILDFEEFMQKVALGKESLSKWLKCEGDNVIAIVRGITNSIGDDRKIIEEEFDLVQRCPMMFLTDEDKAKLLQVIELVKVLDKLSRFVNCCKQLRFKFVKKCNRFKKLETFRGFCNNENHNINSRFDELDKVCNEIHKLFPGDTSSAESLESLLPIVTFFAQLSFHSEIWVFVKDMKWFGDEGQRNFNTMFENVTNVLLADCSGSESFEMSVLDCLEPCVRTLNFIGKVSKEASLQNALAEVKKNSDIMEEEKLERLLKHFRVVQENITSIREWFDSSLDEMSSMFSKFTSIIKSGQYVMNSEQELCLHYFDAASGEKRVLEKDKLSRTIQELSFIKHEKPEKTDHISLFTDEFHLLVRVVDQLRTIKALGFDCAKYSFFPYSLNHSTVAKIEQDLSNMSFECQQWIDSIHERFPTSLLVGVEELLQLKDFVNIFDGDVVDNIMLKSLRYKISNILGSDINEIKLLETLMSARETTGTDQISQLENVSFLVESLNTSFGDPLSPSADAESSGIVLHSCNCCKALQPLATLLVISFAMKVRINTFPISKIHAGITISHSYFSAKVASKV